MSYHFSHFYKLDTTESIDDYMREMFEDVLSNCHSGTKELFLNVTPEKTDVQKHTNNLQTFVDECKKKFPQLKIFMIFNKPMIENQEINFKNVDGMLVLDLYVLSVYDNMISMKENPSWNPINKKILFPTRRSSTLHRIGLLKRLFDRGMRNDIIWSLNDYRNASVLGLTPTEYINQCLENLPGMSFDEVKRFIRDNTKTIVDQDEGHKKASDYGFSVDPNFFTSHIGQIVTETFFDEAGPHHMSEKTWSAMSRHLPFVLFAQEGVVDRLKKMGFHTFDDIDVSTNIYKVIRDLRTLLRNGVDPMIFFQRRSHCDRFRGFYKSFKDPSWPEDVSWQDLKVLPIDTQEEIITNFFSEEEIRTAIRFQSLIHSVVHFKEAVINRKNEVEKMVKQNVKRFSSLGKECQSTVKRFISHNTIELDYSEFIKNLYEQPSWYGSNVTVK